MPRTLSHTPHPMHIGFYAPFKPLNHPDPSGDRIIGSGVRDYLTGRGHRIRTESDLRSRWIYWKPWQWPRVIAQRQRIGRRLYRQPVDLWLTYHCYYKAPDLLGPHLSGHARIPYAIFQGAFSTKRKRTWRTAPGFYLNRAALTAAGHVFTNKRVDLKNLRRIIPERRLTYVAPGISPEDFNFSAQARARLRRHWGVENTPVVVAAAMFRPDVKTESLKWLIAACGRLLRQGRTFYLVIAGAGSQRPKLETLARMHLPGHVRFAGKVPRSEMAGFYSAGDVFAFPGIRESLGMVYLEAQSCGLPVVAFDNGGIAEVVRAGRSGFLTPVYAADPFADAIRRLIDDRTLRRKMGDAAARYVRKHHDSNRNYRVIEQALEEMIEKNGR